MRRILVAALAACLVLASGGAWAQAWPNKPIRFVIPFGPGSASDALARIVGQFRIAMADSDPVMPVGVVTTQPNRSPLFVVTARRG